MVHLVLNKTLKGEKVDNFELGILFGIWSVVTYILCQFFYNKGHDEGMKYSSRVIGTTSVQKKVKRGKKKT